MNQFSANVKKHSMILLLRNLPKDATEEQLSTFLWQRLGINFAPEQLSIKPLEDSANCLAVVTKHSLADFFSRALEGIDFAGRKIEFPIGAGREIERQEL